MVLPSTLTKGRYFLFWDNWAGNNRAQTPLFYVTTVLDIMQAEQERATKQSQEAAKSNSTMSVNPYSNNTTQAK
jgi:hypothetical protein